MDFLPEFDRRFVIYISAIFWLLLVTDFAEAQPKSKKLTQNDINALQAELKKLPNAEQQNQLNAILDRFNERSQEVGRGLDAFGDHLERIGSTPGFPLSIKDIQACLNMHEKTKAIHLQAVDEFSAWGSKFSRVACVRQAAVHKEFFESGSKYFKSYINTLPMATEGERAASALWITLVAGWGGAPSLVPDIESRLKYSAEILGLYITCMGGDEYILGTR